MDKTENRNTGTRSKKNSSFARVISRLLVLLRISCRVHHYMDGDHVFGAIVDRGGRSHAEFPLDFGVVVIRNSSVTGS